MQNQSKSKKRLKRVQIERIHKILESQLDKELYDIVKQKMNMKLPKIVSTKKMDESVESRDMKNELRRQRIIRKQSQKKIRLQNIKTSNFPQAYKTNLYSQETKL